MTATLSHSRVRTGSPRTHCFSIICCMVPTILAASTTFALGSEESQSAQPVLEETPETSKSPADAPEPVIKRDFSQVPLKAIRFVRRLLRKHDLNGSGRLEQAEWSRLRQSPTAIDSNQDGILTEEELIVRLADYGRSRRIRLLYTPPETPLENGSPSDGSSKTNGSLETGEARSDSIRGASPPQTDSSSPPSAQTAPRRETKFYVPAERLPSGLPEWFRSRDGNGDGQLSLREFAPKGTATEVTAFKKHDANGDGVITPREYVGSAMTKKSESDR